VQGHSGEDENVDPSGAGTVQGPRALLGRGSRGQYIVDEKNVAAADRAIVGDRECARQVAPSVPFVQTNLGRRRAVASQQRGDDTKLAPLGEGLGQQEGLIEAPPPKSGNVQRHGYENVMAEG
jgi:hypothetical protein